MIQKIAFEKITEGKCVQMMHVGSFDNKAERINDKLALLRKIESKATKLIVFYFPDIIMHHL